MCILSRERIILIPEDILDEDENQYGHSSGSDEWNDRVKGYEIPIHSLML